MSDKFFTLIHGDTIHRAPNKKVIPAHEFSTTLDAVEVLKKVKEDAEKYRVEISSECEKLKEQSQKEGFEAGFKDWIEHIARLETEMLNSRKELEKMILPVALKAAKKIVGREMELSEGVIVDIVSSCLKSVSTHKKINIYVNRKELDILEANRPRLKQIFEALETLSIRERADIQPGGCIIETEAGIINAQLENQWRVLEKAFESMTKTTPTH